FNPLQSKYITKLFLTQIKLKYNKFCYENNLLYF
ncbi:hypothetical protein LCGC14_2409370, partial [marine sediment metagenome]